MRTRLLIALAFAVSVAQAQVGMRDRYFARYPFDRWQLEGDKTEIRWTTRIDLPKLSAHQRLSGRIVVVVDPKEVAKRRGRGEIATFIQIEDAAGKKWRIHDTFTLTQIPSDAKPLALGWSQETFLLPGDYTVSMAVCDSQTGDHSFARRLLHVSPLRNDALAGAWSGLPAVEFVHPIEEPDGWFAPNVRGRVRVVVDTARPVHIDLLMNLTPSDRASGSTSGFRRNMSVLVPAMKILAGMDVPKGSLDITLLDLARHGIFEQHDARGIDWLRMRSALTNLRPGTIDVQSLAVRTRMAQFFRDQVLLRSQPRPDLNELQIVIVLSAPAFLTNQIRLEPADLPRNPNRRIFYLRYRPQPPRIDLSPYGESHGPPPGMNALPSDDLERALKPLDARIFAISSPEEFRKALANLLTDIRRM